MTLKPVSTGCESCNVDEMGNGGILDVADGVFEIGRVDGGNAERVCLVPNKDLVSEFGTILGCAWVFRWARIRTAGVENRETPNRLQRSA